MINFTALNSMMKDYERTLGIESRLKKLLRDKAEELDRMCDEYDNYPETLRFVDEDKRKHILLGILELSRDIEGLKVVLGE